MRSYSSDFLDLRMLTVGRTAAMIAMARKSGHSAVTPMPLRKVRNHPAVLRK
jgi:hypothetical protein